MAIPQSAKTALQKKAKSSGISYSTLAKVYRRGQAAYMSSGSIPLRMPLHLPSDLQGYPLGQ